MKPAASTKPRPRGKKGVLSRIQIITNKTARGKRSIKTFNAKKQNNKAKNSSAKESADNNKTINIIVSLLNSLQQSTDD